MRVLVIFLLSVSLLNSCLNKAEVRKDKEGSSENIFYDYRIWAEEETPEVTVMLQYRFDDEEGETLVLDNPSKVSLDGIELKVDSAKLTGFFYEAVKPVDQFIGQHTIEFVDYKKKKHIETFRFAPFSLETDIPEAIKKQPFSIRLKEFPDEPTKLRLVMIDTAYDSPDVNEELLVRNRTISITQRYFSNLSNGPITLEIYLEDDQPLKNAAKEGGRLLITYGLRRQFIFAD